MPDTVCTKWRDGMLKKSSDLDLAGLADPAECRFRSGGAERMGIKAERGFCVSIRPFSSSLTFFLHLLHLLCLFVNSITTSLGSRPGQRRVPVPGSVNSNVVNW